MALIKHIGKLGANMRIVYLPTTDFKAGELVKIVPRPAISNLALLRPVVRKGKNLIVVIPKSAWVVFPLKSQVQIIKFSLGLSGK